MIAWFAQTDDGQGWMVSADGVMVEDSGRKKEIVRMVQSGLNVEDRPFGFSEGDDALWGYLISDIKNGGGRNQVAGFRVDRDGLCKGGDEILRCLEPLAIKISSARKREFVRALNRQLKKRCGLLTVFVLVVLSILAFLWHFFCARVVNS